MMQCNQCATPIPDDSRFCLNCGSLVSDAEGQKRASVTMDASSTARMERILRQDTAGEFEIDRQLGKGGMACVYLATEVRLGRRVAIKVLPPELTFGHGVERFVREAKTAAALDHPNIIPIYRITSGDTIFWYAMKFIEGKSLDELVKEHKVFDVETTIEILGQASDALEYAHRKMVIHRDVKPANMMLDEHGRVVVTDFGIAKALTEGTLTASGAAIGTPYYMSPEQAMGGTVSGAADQYSLGVVAYQMLSGQLPFEGESAVEILHKHTSDDPTPLEVLRPGLPAHVYTSVARAMEKKAADRFASIKAFVDGLRGIATPEVRRSATLVVGAKPSTPSGPARKPSPARPASAPAPKRGRGVAIAAAVVFVAAGAGGFAWYGSQQSGPEVAGPLPDSTTEPRPVALDTTRAVDSARADSQISDAAPPPPTTGRVTIGSLPPGGRVIVNGRPRSGRSLTLNAGTHVIRLEADGFEPFTDTVRVIAGAASNITFPARAVVVEARPPDALRERGILMLSVEPWATIAIDGAVRRGNRNVVDTLRTGIHQITLTRDGYQRVDTTVTIREGQEHRMALRIRPVP